MEKLKDWLGSAGAWALTIYAFCVGMIATSPQTVFWLVATLVVLLVLR